MPFLIAIGIAALVTAAVFLVTYREEFERLTRSEPDRAQSLAVPEPERVCWCDLPKPEGDNRRTHRELCKCPW
jgi:hypothetical protein